MITQLRSLRIEAGLDSSQYKAGAQQVVDANTAMARSFAASDAAMTRLPAGMARLSNEFIPGYREANKFLGVLDRINRAMGEGLDTNRAVVMLENLERSFGRTIDRADILNQKLGSVGQVVHVMQANRSQDFINNWAGVNRGRGSEINAFNSSFNTGNSPEYGRLANAAHLLRMELDPLSAAQDQLTADLGDYAAMARVGVLSSDELTAAVARRNNSFASEAENIKRWHNNVRLGRHEVANLSYQLNDIAVMTASGQAPFMMLMQQGMQIGQILGPRGLRGGVAALGQGIFQFLTNPVNLAVVGFAGLATAAVYAYQQITTGGKTTKDMLEEQSKLVQRIKETFRGINTEAAAGPAIMLRVMAEVNLGETRKKITADIDALTKEIMPRWNGGGRSGAVMLQRENLPFKDAIEGLNGAVKTGSPDIEKYLERIGQIAQESPSAEVRKAAAAIGDMSAEILKATLQSDALARALNPLAERFRALGSARAMFGEGAGLDPLSSFTPDLTPDRDRMRMTADMMLRNATTMSQVEAVTRKMGQAETYWAQEKQKSLQLAELDLQSIYAKTPAQKAQIAGERALVEAINTTQSSEETAIKASQARRAAFEQAAYAISEQTRQLRESSAIEIASITAKSPTQKADIAAMRERMNALNAGASLEEANTRAVIASDVAYRQAAYAISEQSKQRLRAANDNVAQQKLEIDLVGAGAYQRALATANLQTHLDLQREAAQNGLAFDQAQYDILVKKNAELARQADLLAQAKLLQELRTDRRKAGMTEGEANRFDRLKGAGIAENSTQWAMLNQEMIDTEFAQMGFFRGARQCFEDISKEAANYGQTIRNGINDIYRDGEEMWVNFAKTGKLSFKDIEQTAIGVLSKLSYQMAMDSALSLFRGGSSAGNSSGGGLLGSIFNVLFSANGNAFNQGNVMAFANGGAFTNSVVTRPTGFPIGVMGERGPEAVMPLARTSGGKLGVVASGGSGGEVRPVNINMAFNYSGPANENSAREMGDFVLSRIRREIPSMIADSTRRSKM